MFKFVKKIYLKNEKKKRLEQMKKKPFKKINSENMTDIEKMNSGFNGKTYSINGMDIDF